MALSIDGTNNKITSDSGSIDFGDDNVTTTGTIPAAQLTGTLPALNAAALTSVNAANLTGTVPAGSLSGATYPTNVPNVAPGSNGNVLTSNGSAWTSAAAAGGGTWELINTVVCNNDATVTITGIGTSHSMFAIAVSNVRCSASGNLYHLNLGTSSGIDTSGVYLHNVTFSHVSNTFESNTSTATIRFGVGALEGASDSTTKPNHTWSGMYYLAVRGRFPIIHGTYGSFHNNSDTILGGGNYWGAYKVNNAYDRIQVKNGSGNLVDGRITVWGIKHD